MENNLTDSIKNENYLDLKLKINNLEIKNMKHRKEVNDSTPNKPQSDDSDEIIEFEKIDIIDPNILKIPFSSTNRYLKESRSNLNYFTKDSSIIKERKQESFSLISKNTYAILCGYCQISIASNESK